LKALATTLPVSETTTFLDRQRSSIDGQVELEARLSRVLRPDQLARYSANAGSDPCYGADSRKTFTHATTASLGQRVASEWTKTFKLDAAAAAHARTVASQYVAQALAVAAVSPDLDPTTRRLETLHRTRRLVELQQEAEKQLAAAPLTGPQRARAMAGSSSVFFLRLSR
jgi:hypothetical protein